MAVTILTPFGRRMDLRIGANDEGNIAVNPPPPGSFYLDPFTDVEPFKEALDLAAKAAIERRKRLGS